MQWFSFSLHDFSISFLSILLEGIPFMFLGTLISGIIDAFVPASAIERRLPKNTTAAIIIGGLMGIVLPMCECGVVPVIRRMLKKGLPISCAMAYLLAAPIVNVLVAISTYMAFRGQDPGTVTSLRLIMGFSVAVLVASLVQRLPLWWVLNQKLHDSLNRSKRVTPSFALSAVDEEEKGSGELKAEPSVAFTEAPRLTFGHKMVAAIRCAAYDFLDIGFYLVLGAAIASAFSGISREAIAPLATDPALSTGVMMLVAMILSLCSTSDAFIAANFIGFPIAAKLAFMVMGPMMDLKLMFMYQMVFRKRFIFALTAVLFLLIGFISHAVSVALTP